MTTKILDFRAGCVSFYGRMYISLERGSVNIHGYHIKKGPTLEVYAPSHSLPIQVKSKYDFTLILTTIPIEKLSPLERKYYSVERPDFFQLSDGIYYSQTFPELQYDAEKIKEIDSRVKATSRLMIIGDSDTGKSTFARFYTNHLLNKYPEVAYLDVDPGQSENSLPRTLSLTIVKSPIFGPPEMNDKNQKTIVDYGYLHPTDKQFYYESITKLLSVVPQGIPLIVNSLGQLFKAGAVVHSTLFKIIRPHLRVLIRRPEPLEFPQIYANSLELVVKRIENVSLIKKVFKRELRYSTYLTRMIGPTSLQKPKVLKMKKTYFYFNQPIILTEVLNYAIGSIAFLLKSTDSVERIVKKPEDKKKLIKILRNFKPSTYHSAALIRAFDVEAGLIYLNTPDSLDEIDVLHIFPDELLATVVHDHPTQLTFSDALIIKKPIFAYEAPKPQN